jgi:WD40 repeat protein
LRQLASHEQLDRIIRQLTDQRFLVAGEQTIEVAHESLLTEVPLIRNWIEENRERIRLRDRFERNCREWHEQGKSPDYLLNRGRLAAVEEWIAKDQPALSDKETEFLRQSRELRDRETQAQLEQERRLREEAEARARAEAEKAAIEGEKTQLAIAAARKLKARAVGLGILLITSLGAFLLAFWQYRNAVQQSELNDARRLEVLAQEALSQSPMQALLLSLEVAGRGFKTESSSVLWQALKEVKEEAYLLGHVDNVVEGEFSKNGEYVLTVGDQTAKLWNLKNLAAPITLNAHKNLVLHGEFSPNNQKILTIGFKEKAIIWNRQNLSQPAAILPVPNGKLNHGSFSQDGRKVITVGDGFVIVWTLDELGKPIQQKSVSGVDGKIVKGVFSPVDSNEILIADAAGEVHFINLENPTEARSFAHKDYVQSAIFNQAKPNLILTASYDNTAKVWDLSQPGNQAIATLKHDGYVREAAFDPKNPNRIVTVSADKTARIWDISDRLKIQPLYTLKGHGDTLRHGEFSPHNSKIILTTSEDGTARVWNLEKPDTPTVLRGHVGQVYSGKFHPQDPNRILTTGQDDIARIWNLQPFNNPQVLSGHSGAVSLAVFDPKDTSRILTVSEDLTARVWNLKKAGEVIVLKGHQEEIEWGSFSPQNPNLVLTASLDGTARLWSLKTQTAIELKHNKDVVKASFSPKGDKIVTASYDYTAKLWEVDAAGKVTQLGKPLQHKDTVEHAAFSQQGNLVVTTSRDTTAKVWNLRQTEQAIATLKHDDIIIYAEFDPNDENRVLTVGFDRTAKLWDLRSPDREIARLTGHQGPIVYANFSQDSKQVLTVSRDGTARVWNLAARNSIELKGHKSAINYGMFHPQNHHLVITASSDRTVRLWDVRDPEHPIVLSGHTAPVKTAIFSPTENPLQILTASQDGKAAVYTIPSWEQIVNAAWQRATRCLSQEEKRNFVLSSEQNIPQQSLLSQFLNLTMQKPYPNCK